LTPVDSPWSMDIAIGVSALAVSEKSLHVLLKPLAGVLSLLHVLLKLWIIEGQVLEHILHCVLQVSLEGSLVKWTSLILSASILFCSGLRVGRTIGSASLSCKRHMLSFATHEWAVLSWPTTFPVRMSRTSVAVVMLWSSTVATTPVVRWTLWWMRVSSENRCNSVDFSVSLYFRMLIFVNNCKDCNWSLRWIVDLQECVRVLSSFLTGGAEIKILADTALVSRSNDWGHTATIAFDVHVLDLACD